MIKNLEQTAERIRQAVNKKEQIIIFSDSDLDGAVSAVILKEAIDNLASALKKKVKVEAFSPDRRIEGYGLNESALNFIAKKFKKGLIITLDCGITNFEEIDKAKELGFSVLIVDHHKPVEGKLPLADIIVDPYQEGDEAGFKDYANSGIVFKLAEKLLKNHYSELLKESFLELVALATIADMMPEEDENREFIIEGLKNIENSNRPALKAMFSLFKIDDFSSKRDMITKINSVLGSSRSVEHVSSIYLFLLEPDEQKARIDAKVMVEENNERHRQIVNLTEDIKQVALEKNLPIIFEGDEAYELEYLGAVASRVCNALEKPVFLYQKYDDFSRGTVRVPKGIDAVKAMQTCKDLLKTYGGHAPAAGFSVKNENLEKFKGCLIDYFEKKE